MPVKTIGTGRGLMGGGAYADKVRGFGPIAYWPLWEASGTVARCLVNPAQNGTYSSDVSTWPVGTGIGDGNTAPAFDGANDRVDVLTAALTAVFSGSLGSMFMWVKVANAGVWTDGVERRIINLESAGGDYMMIRKLTTNDRLDWRYFRGGGAAVSETIVFNQTTWFPVGMTWSATANQVIYYVNGAQSGAIDACAGWVQALNSRAYIGCAFVGPANVWSGPIAHVGMWGRVLSATEIAALSVV